MHGLPCDTCAGTEIQRRKIFHLVSLVAKSTATYVLARPPTMPWSRIANARALWHLFKNMPLLPGTMSYCR